MLWRTARQIVDVKKRAALPLTVMGQAVGFPQSVEKGSAGKRRLDRDLNIEQLGLLREVIHGIETIRGLAIQPQHEAAVDADSVRLDATNCLLIFWPVLEFPMGTFSRLLRLRWYHTLRTERMLDLSGTSLGP